MGDTGDDYTPPEGFDGNLTDDQTAALKEMWREYFKVTRRDDDGSHDKVAGVEVDEDADVDEDVSSDPDKIEGGKAAFNDKAKDDAAKDEQAKQREEKETAKLLGTTSPKELRQAFWDGSRGETPDALMLRFLRARKWDVSRSFAMCASVGKWRLDNDVEGIKKKGEEGLCKEDGFRLQYDSGKVYVMGTDKHDRPLVWIHVAKHKIGEQSQKALQRFTIFGIESAKALLTPRSNGQGCIIMDLTNFGLSNMDWKCLRFLIEVFEARYPETLGRFVMHKAPLIVNPIWALISPLLDPVVRNKIVFTYNEKDLAEYIDPKHLKKSMGGEMDWEWSYSGPVDGENKRLTEESDEKTAALKAWDEATYEFEELTMKWLEGDEEAGKKRAKYGNALIMTRHYDSDPYVRGQTVYMRNGTSVGDGRVRWKYPDGVEEFGKSYDEIRKEYGIEGKCPRNGHVDGPVAAAQQALDATQDPDEAADYAAGKTGGSRVGRLKRRASHSLGSLTKSKSSGELARDHAEAEQDRLQRELDKAKAEQEEEDKRKEAEDRRRREEEEAAQQKKGLLGALSAVTGTLASTAISSTHAAAGYVPAAVGGERLRQATAPERAAEDKGQEAT